MSLILHNAKFRLLWLNTATNDIGLMMYFTAHGWLALTVTDSPFWTGATAGMGGLGLVLFSIVAGVLVDRMDRRRLIMGAQAAQVAMSFILAALIFSDQIQLWHILLFAFLHGTMVAIKVPSRMALTLDVVGRKDLLSATATNFIAMTSMGVVVPPIAGLMLESFNMGWAYVLMGSAHIVSASLLLFLRVERADRPAASPFQDFKQGVRYVFTTPRVRTLILMALIGEGFGWAHETMMPVMARDVLDAGASGLGYLLSAGSAGALASTVVVSALGDVREKGRMLVGGYAGFGFFLILFAVMSWLLGSLPLALVLIALAYASVIVYETSLGTLIQTTVPDHMRGRVLSFQIMTWGVTGTSGFHTGAIATLLGAPVAIAIGGGVVVANALRLVSRVAIYREPAPEDTPERVTGD